MTAHGVQGRYPLLAMPPGVLPIWLLAPAWAALQAVAGAGAWLVWRRVDIGVEPKRAALRIWGWGLLADAAWSPAFLGPHGLGSLGIVLAMLGAALLAAQRFRPLQPAGAAMMVAYAAWLAYAAYLSAGAWWLNQG